MIVIKEQHGYKSPLKIEYDLSAFDSVEPHKKVFKQKRGDGFCYQVIKDENDLKIEASYFVGVDWFIENQLAINIQPKLTTDKTEINFTKMLFDALEEPENLNHLDHLFEIHFDKQPIKIEQTEDLFTPLLIIQYLQLLKKIVHKGLKKSYYPVIKNLNARVKGKILINTTIKNNHYKNKLLHSYCKYDEFGINTIENKVLKKALLFSYKAIQNIKGIEPEKLQGLYNYIQPAFYDVDEEVKIEDLKSVIANPLFKEYEQALKLANLILKRFGYNISSVNATIIETPPFWIDMSKLFELYVFSKLRALFPNSGEVIYHKKYNYLEPDFIVNSPNNHYRFVVDAKYKPQYENNNVSTEDIRQISGYARLKSIYRELGINEKEAIDCLIIFSQQSMTTYKLDKELKLFPNEYYAGFYKMGIKLPEIVNKKIPV